MSMFRPATRERLKAKIALGGLPGVGKTSAALAIATGLGPRIAVIDTENESARLYAGTGPEEFRFDVCPPFPSYNPKYLVEALKIAADSGYDVAIVDTLSRFWNGKGGVTEIADKAGEAANFSFAGWKEATPIQNEMIEAILNSPIHVIVTMRSRIKYALETNDKGKVAPRKLGLGYVQRADAEYEFGFVLNLDRAHTIHFEKSRLTPLHGQRIKDDGLGKAHQIGVWKALGRQILDWLDNGVEGSGVYQLRAPLLEELNATIAACLKRGLARQADIKGALTKRGVLTIGQLQEDQALSLLGGLHHRIHVADFKALVKQGVDREILDEESISAMLAARDAATIEDLSSEDIASITLKLTRLMEAVEPMTFGLPEGEAEAAQGGEPEGVAVGSAPSPEVSEDVPGGDEDEMGPPGAIVKREPKPKPAPRGGKKAS